MTRRGSPSRLCVSASPWCQSLHQNVMEEAGYLNQTRRAKSVTLAEPGLEHARALAARFLSETGQDP